MALGSPSHRYCCNLHQESDALLCVQYSTYVCMYSSTVLPEASHLYPLTFLQADVLFAFTASSEGIVF
jgi:hypothetical protein